MSEPAGDDARPGDLLGLQARLGLEFADPNMLLSALTHGSWLNEAIVDDVPDGERLEFLGDALVDFVAADYLFRRLPGAPEGELTRLRAALVCEPALAGFARQLALGEYLRVGKGEHASGGRQRPAILADAFESLVGAVLIDRGFAAAESLVMRFVAPELEEVQRRHRSKDAKSRFQELSQKRWQLTPRYETVETSGPDHLLSFVVEARVAGRTLGVGHGRSKAHAAQMAAEAALDTAAHIEHPNELDEVGSGDA